MELYFILGFNVESASHFERLGALYTLSIPCWQVGGSVRFAYFPPLGHRFPDCQR